MRIVTGNKIGTTINLMIDGVLHSKECETEERAKEFFDQLIKTKKDPSDENFNKLYGFLSKNMRIAREGGFEFDPETGKTFMEGFNTPIPDDLMKTIEEYIENDYPMESVKNFWKLLMANPDKRVRNDLFNFIKTHDFSITDKGYMVVYKTVEYKNKSEDDLASFISNSFVKIKNKWKKSPTNYVVYKETTSAYKVTEKLKFESWVENDDTKKFELIGNLNELQKNIDKIDKNKQSIFTDKYSRKMTILLGKPVKQERKNCDGDPKRDCSNGLHVGATKYVESFRTWYRGSQDSPVLVCLVNPMHVVAVPEYDHSKMRVCEYFPFAYGTVDENNKIEIIESSYFENDYVAHEEEELSKLLKANDEEIRQTARNVDEDDRDIDEYLKILESRVIDLNDSNNEF